MQTSLSFLNEYRVRKLLTEFFNFIFQSVTGVQYNSSAYCSIINVIIESNLFLISSRLMLFLLNGNFEKQK